MLIRRRRANLIDMYWSTLRNQRIPEPPAGLDDETARLIAQLDLYLTPPDAGDLFVSRLWGELNPAADSTETRRAWAGPAINPTQQRRTRTRPMNGPEERVTMSDITSKPEPTQRPERRWSRELLKVAAAIAIFAVIGLVLALVLRDNEDEPAVVQPGPTATPAASATTMATQAVVATATPVQATATVPEATATMPPPTVTPSPPPAPTRAPLTNAPTFGTVAAVVPVGQQPDSMIGAAGSIWVATTADGAVTRIDPATNTVMAVISVGQPWGGENVHPIQIVHDGDEVWVLHPGDNTIMRIDPATNTIAQTIEVDDGDFFVNDFQRFAVSHGDAWISDTQNRKIVRLDLATGVVEAEIAGSLPHSIGATDDAIWVLLAGEGAIVRIDPATNEIVARLKPDDGQYQLVMVVDGELWAATTGVVVQRIDPATNEPVVAVEMPSRVGEVTEFARGAGSIWITNLGTHEMFRVDSTTGDVLAVVDMGFPPIVRVFTNDSLWVADPVGDRVLRIAPAE